VVGGGVGPLLTAVTMKQFGSDAFFWSMGVLCLMMAVYGFIRVLFYKYVPEEDRHEFSIHATNAVAAPVLADD